MTRAKVAGLTVAALAAAAAGAVVYSRLHHKPPDPAHTEPVEELEERIKAALNEPRSRLAKVLGRIAPPDVGHVEGLSAAELLLLRLKALRRGTLRPPAEDNVESTLERLGDEADLEGL